MLLIEELHLGIGQLPSSVGMFGARVRATSVYGGLVVQSRCRFGLVHDHGFENMFLFRALSECVHCVQRGSSAVECRTRNQVTPGSNPHFLPFRRLGIFVLSIDAPVDSAVYMST